MSVPKKKSVTKKRTASKKVARKRSTPKKVAPQKPAPPAEPKTSFTPDEAKRILQADLAKLVQKAKDPNKRLTVAERNMLHQLAASTEEENANALADPALVPSIAALCGVLGVTRETYYDWTRKFPKDVPANTTNGSYDVAAWREFAKRNNLKGGTPDESDETDLETLEGLRKEDLRVKIEERNFKLAILRQDFLSREDVRDEIVRLVSSSIKLLRDRFENELPPVCAGLDAVRLRAENAKAIDEVCAILQGGGESIGERSLDEQDEQDDEDLEDDQE